MTEELLFANAGTPPRDVALYLDWNNTIWTHFFNPSNADQPVALSLDDDELDALGRKIGVTDVQAAAQLFSVVRTLSRPGTKNVFGWWTRDPGRAGLPFGGEDYLPPTYIGLLGASVLVASRMGELSSDSDKFSYWPNFNQLVLGTNSAKSPEGAPELDKLWRHLQRYLKDDCEGKLGLLSIPVVTEFSHINFPISQVILRTSDRKALRGYFEVRYPGQTAPSRSEIFDALRRDADSQQMSLPPVFRRLILLRQADETLFTALEEEVWLTYQSWTKTRINSRTRLEGNVTRSKIAEADDYVVRHYDTAPRTTSAAEAKARVDDGSEVRHRLIWRLKFQPFIPALSLEIPDGSLVDEILLDSPTHDGWRQVRDLVLTGVELKTGANITAGDNEYHFAIRLPLVFEDTQFGWIQRDWIPRGHKICVLVQSETGPDLWQFASNTDPNACEIPVSEKLVAIDCVQFTIPLTMQQDQIPVFLGELQVEKPGRLQLTGGLRINSSTYFLKAPPSVIVDDLRLGDRSVALNGNVLALPIELGLPYLLPSHMCNIGVNEIVIGGRIVEFRAQLTSMGELDQDAGVGFAVSRLFGTMRTESDAGGVKEKFLRSVRGFVIIGPQILPDNDY